MTWNGMVSHVGEAIITAEAGDREDAPGRIDAVRRSRAESKQL